MVQIKFFDLNPLPNLVVRLVGARVFEALLGQTQTHNVTEIELDSNYARSLVDQLNVARRYEEETSNKASKPSDVQTSTVPETDPWGRHYILKFMHPNIVVVQSTGPSGVDRSKNLKDALKLNEGKKFFMLGDNLVVVQESGVPARDRPRVTHP